jgi:RNA polymerase sigma factor (sigma-70 family)
MENLNVEERPDLKNIVIDLYRTRRCFFVSFASRYLDGNRADAEECVQEAIISGLDHIEGFRVVNEERDVQQSIFYWLLVVIKNRAYEIQRRYCKRAKYHSNDRVSTIPDDRADSELLAETRHRLRVTLEAVRALSDRYTDVAHHLMDGDDVNEMSIFFGVPEGDIYNWMTRTRRNLRQHLLNNGQDWVGDYAPARATKKKEIPVNGIPSKTALVIATMQVLSAEDSCDVVTVHDLAKRLGWSYDTVYFWLKPALICGVVEGQKGKYKMKQSMDS